MFSISIVPGGDMGSEQNEAVISGIAGKFPECCSVDELKEKLLSKSILIKPDELRKLNIREYAT